MLMDWEDQQKHIRTFVGQHPYLFEGPRASHNPSPSNMAGWVRSPWYVVQNMCKSMAKPMAFLMFSISRRDGTRSIQSQFSGSGDPFFLVKIVKPPILWVIHHQFGKSHPNNYQLHQEVGATSLRTLRWGGRYVLWQPCWDTCARCSAVQGMGSTGSGWHTWNGWHQNSNARKGFFNDCMSKSQAHAAIDSERSNSRTVIPQRL